MAEYRASFDAAIRFSNGGDLTARGFRVDVPSLEVSEAEIAALFVASLGLLMTDTVVLSNVEVFAEPHKGTRGGPSDRSIGLPSPGAGGRLVELSHVIRAGLITVPGLPGPTITPYLTREASRERYGPGTEFAIDTLTLVGNTATYLDAPYHRYPDGADLSAIPLAQTADLPATVVRVAGSGQHAIDVGAVAGLDVRGTAVLLHTGDDTRHRCPVHGRPLRIEGCGQPSISWGAGCRGANQAGHGPFEKIDVSERTLGDSRGDTSAGVRGSPQAGVLPGHLSTLP